MHVPRHLIANSLPRALAAIAICLTLLAGSRAEAYGYAKDEDPLLKAFQAAIRAARSQAWPKARAQTAKVRWQLDELRQKEDLNLDFRQRFSAAHSKPTAASVTQAWVNLVYLGLLQKLHWNLKEKLTKYHPSRARLEAARAYYEVALAGNVRRNDALRRKKDPKAPSRHADVVKQFAAAKKALGSPGLLGTGKRAPDPLAFKRASLRIAGHLRAVFPAFARPGDPKKKSSPGQ
ncbi:MAG: hypothetical protein JKY65_29845 [Planctomycetes bacterium]|nr:hypothetical protein [Planctomycetota bacterium]